MSPGLQVLTPSERFALDDLFSAYHWALDMGDVEGFADTFTAQPCVVLHTARGVQRFSGHAGLVHLVESLRAWDAFPGCQHHSGQLLIEAAGPGFARVRSYVQVVECRGEPAYALRYAGRSDDRVRFVDGRARFQSRVIRLWREGARVNQRLSEAEECSA